MPDSLDALEERILGAQHLLLFLDYDGTLAEFAPTPDDVLPNPEIIRLLDLLVAHPFITPAVISGRKLPHLQRLLPVKGLLIAGTYGIELQTTDGKIQHAAETSHIRPELEKLKPAWQDLACSQPGIYLEDKYWSLALHAKNAAPDHAEYVLNHARELAEGIQSATFRILGGDRFLEIAPAAASKAFIVGKLLQQQTLENSTALYIGDDDKDEEAFAVVQQFRGFAVKVAHEGTPTLARWRLDGPAAVRSWLRRLSELV